MPTGDRLYRIATKVPEPVIKAAQELVARSPRARRLGRRLTGSIRTGVKPIAAGPAKGMLMDLAGSRPGYLLATTEQDTVAWLQEHIRPGMTVYDLGANVGYLTLVAAALAGPSGRVIAYEPFPETAGALRRNVELNGLAHVEVVQAAISDRTGTATLGVGDDEQQASLVAERTTGQVEVRTVTLDDEATRLGAPDVIKCDIEGAEHVAFTVAGEALARHPALLCEVHQFQPGDRDRFFALIKNHGYDPEWLNGSDDAWWSHLSATSHRGLA